MKPIFLFLALVLVASCASVTPWYPQNYAGLAHWSVEWCEGQPCKASVWDGKEKTDVEVVITRNPDGSVEFAYRAAGVQNADLIRARAALDASQSRAAVEVGGQVERVLDSRPPPE